MIYEIYENTIAMNPPSDGGFNLLGLQAVLSIYSKDLERVQLTRQTLLRCLRYFLNRSNTQLSARRKLAAQQ